MTRTEQDLRDALRGLAGLAGRPVPEPTRRHRPVRTRAAVLAVAAVLVLAVGVSVVAVLRTGPARTSGPVGVTTAPTTTGPTTVPDATTTDGSTPPSADLAPFSPLRSVFSLDPAAGYTLAGRRNTATVQSGYVLFPDRSKAEVDVLVYAAGAFDPTSARTGTPITVQGTAGWRGPVTDPASTLTLTSDVWEYAPDAWVVVTDRSGLTSGGSTAAEQLAVAEAVRIADPPAPLAVPFRIGSLPAGLTVEVVQTATAGGTLSASIGFADDLAGVTSRLPGNGGALTVRFGTDVAVPTGPAGVDVGGHRGWQVDGPLGVGGFPARALIVEYGDVYGVFTVDGLHLDRYDDATVAAIAAATVTVGALTDPTTWSPAADAVPVSAR